MHLQLKANGQIQAAHYGLILHTLCCTNITKVALILTQLCPSQIPHGMSGGRIRIGVARSPAVCCVACNVHVYNEEIIQSCGSRNSLPPSLVYK
jgi:hypothetical protein